MGVGGSWSRSELVATIAVDVGRAPPGGCKRVWPTNIDRKHFCNGAGISILPAPKMDQFEDDTSQTEREQLSEDTERLKRALLEAVAAEAASISQSDQTDDSEDEGGPPSPVPGTSAQYEDGEGNVSFDLGQPLRSVDGSGELPVNYEACLLLNRAYQEILTDSLNQIQTALDYNREKQTSCQIMMEEAAQFKQTKKNNSKPQYMKLAMPYFKDVNGMTAPLNADTLTKNQKKERTAFLKYPKRLNARDVRELTKAVKSQVLLKLMQPPMNRKEVLVEKLDKLDPNSETAEDLKSNINEIDEHIEAVSSMSDNDIFELSITMHEDIDWVFIASSVLEGSVSDLQLKHAWLNIHNPLIKTTKWTKEEDEELCRLVVAYEERNWADVAEGLGTGRTAIQCLQRYMTALNPALKSGKWSKEESKLLQEVIENCTDDDNHISWLDVAENMDGRTPDQCEKQSKLMNEIRDGHVHKWTQEEDDLLMSLREKFGEKKWDRIADFIPGRDSERCRERWMNHLDRRLKFEDFTYSEDRIIWKYCSQCEAAGEKPKWAQLAKTMGGRTDAQVTIRYNRLKMWKTHWEFYEALPENIQEFIRDHLALQSESRKKKFRRIKKAKMKHTSHKQTAEKNSDIKQNIPWDMTEEEKLLYEEDMKEGFIIPTPMPFENVCHDSLTNIMAREMERYKRLVETVHMLMRREEINLTHEEVNGAIEFILAGKNESPNSHKRMLYCKIRDLHKNYTIKRTIEVAREIKMFIMGKMPKRGKRNTRRTLDEKIEALIANKFLTKKTMTLTEKPADAPISRESQQYDSIVLGLFLKALNADIEKAVGLADRHIKEKQNTVVKIDRKLIEQKLVEQKAVDSVLKVLKVENVQAAMERFPALQEKLQKYSENRDTKNLKESQRTELGDEEENGSTEQPNGQGEGDQDAIQGNSTNKKTNVEDPLGPIVKKLYAESCPYKMPPFPPTLSSLHAYRTLCQDRKNLIKIAGDLYSPDNVDMEEDSEAKQQNEIKTEKYRRRMLTFEKLHDFHVFKNRFTAMFTWPALLASMELPKECLGSKRPQIEAERVALENSNIPGESQERIVRGGPIFRGSRTVGKNGKLRYVGAQSQKKRKLGRMRREKKIEMLKNIYAGREKEKQKIGERDRAASQTTDEAQEDAKVNEEGTAQEGAEMDSAGGEHVAESVATENAKGENKQAAVVETGEANEKSEESTPVTKKARGKRKRAAPPSGEARRTSDRISKRSWKISEDFVETSSSPKRAKMTLPPKD